MSGRRRVMFEFGRRPVADLSVERLSSVAGVVSGAGDLRPGLLLDGGRRERGRRPVALMGQVHCKVDSRYGDVEVGDLLTTSPTPGHATKADPAQAFGAVIGKALRPLRDGSAGLVPILIALQ